MKHFFTVRGIFLITCFLIGAFFIVAAYLQYHVGLQPCSLCQLQRIMLGAIGIIALFATIQNPKRTGTKIYSIFIIMFSLLGSTLAIRQVYLQMYSPASLNDHCGASIDYMLRQFPLLEALQYILQGTGNCAIVSWQVLGLSLAAWSLMGFTLLAFIGVWLFLYGKLIK